MNKFKTKFGIDLLKILLQLIVIFASSLIWTIPVKLILNNIIAVHCNFEAFGFWDCYWMTLIFMILASSKSSVNEKNK